MAKKATQPVPVPEPEPEPVQQVLLPTDETWEDIRNRKGRGWKGELVRELHGKHPNLSNTELAAEFHKHSQESISLASVGNALRGDDEGSKPRKGDDKPTLAHLNVVIAYCGNHDIGLSKLAEEVEELADLAGKVGGLDNLQAVIKTAAGLLALRK